MRASVRSEPVANRGKGSTTRLQPWVMLLAFSILSASPALRGATVTGRVTAKATGEPLKGARVIVAVPATDMRKLRHARDRHGVFETVTDANGQYEIDVRISDKTEVSLDALCPAYRSSAGPLMLRGDNKKVVLSPRSSVIWEVDFALEPALYVAGVVVDERGRPLAGVEVRAGLRGSSSFGNVSLVRTDNTGRFEFFDFPVATDGLAGGKKAEIVCEHPDLLRMVVEDVYELDDAERRKLRIQLNRGLQISGLLVDANGKPAPDALIEATQALDHRKTARTDKRGRFRLTGLPEGNVTILALAKKIKQKTKQEMALQRNRRRVTLRLEPIRLTEDLRRVKALGMTLVDVNPELREGYDLHHDAGALVLEAEPRSSRLTIGTMQEGDNFWLVGRNRVHGVQDFIKRILEEVEGQEPRDGKFSVRVVYQFRRDTRSGSNTQHMSLTVDDVRELREALKQASRPE